MKFPRIPGLGSRTPRRPGEGTGPIRKSTASRAQSESLDCLRAVFLLLDPPSGCCPYPASPTSSRRVGGVYEARRPIRPDLEGRCIRSRRERAGSGHEHGVLHPAIDLVAGPRVISRPGGCAAGSCSWTGRDPRRSGQALPSVSVPRSLPAKGARSGWRWRGREGVASGPAEPKSRRAQPARSTNPSGSAMLWIRAGWSRSRCWSRCAVRSRRCTPCSRVPGGVPGHSRGRTWSR